MYTDYLKELDITGQSDLSYPSCINGISGSLIPSDISDESDAWAPLTGKLITDTLKSICFTISIDGRGQAMDNVINKRLWGIDNYHYLQMMLEGPVDQDSIP